MDLPTLHRESDVPPLCCRELLSCLEKIIAARKLGGFVAREVRALSTTP